MQCSAVIVALLAAALTSCPIAAQEFMTEQDFVQSTAVDRLIFPDDPTVAPFPYVSPLEQTYFAVDAIAFRRDNTGSVRLATVDDPDTTVLSSGDLDFLNEPGLRLLWGRRMNDFFALEIGYFGLLEWDASAAVRDEGANAVGTEGNLFSPFTDFGDPAVAGLDYNNYAAARTETKFNNAELNLRQRLEMPYSTVQVTALYGLRYMNIRDRFEYRSRSSFPGPDGTTNAADVNAKNNMYGVQLGGSIEFHVEHRAWLSFEMKGIMLQNDTTQATDYTIASAAGTTTTAGSSSKGRVTFAGDIQGACTWKFTPSLVGRVGYQAIFFDGLALGSENFESNALLVSTSPSELVYKGQATFHGPFVGLVYTW